MGDNDTKATVVKALEELIVEDPEINTVWGENFSFNCASNVYIAVAGCDEKAASAMLKTLRELKGHGQQQYRRNPNPEEEQRFYQAVSRLACVLPMQAGYFYPVMKSDALRALYLTVMDQLSTQMMAKISWNKGVLTTFNAFAKLMANLHSIYSTEHELSDFVAEIGQKKGIGILFEQAQMKEPRDYLNTIISEDHPDFEETLKGYIATGNACILLRALARLNHVVPVTELALKMPELMQQCNRNDKLSRVRQSVYLGIISILAGKAVQEGSPEIALKLIAALPNYLDTGSEMKAIIAVIKENSLSKAYACLKQYLQLD